MSEENMETPVETTVEVDDSATETPEISTEETTETPVTTEAAKDDPKALAREHYRKRQEEKLERENRQRLEEQKQELYQQIEAGEMPSEETVLHEVLQEKDQKLKEYALKDFFAENPEYVDHKDAITNALKEPRYANLSHEEVANLVAAKSVLQLKEQDRKVQSTSAVQGTSARAANTPIDYRNMTRDELEKRAAAAKFR